jgi:fumarate hydratase, class I
VSVLSKRLLKLMSVFRRSLTHSYRSNPIWRWQRDARQIGVFRAAIAAAVWTGFPLLTRTSSINAGVCVRLARGWGNPKCQEKTRSLKTYPTHAASLPVALIPNCAATRHVTFRLDGRGPAHFEAPRAGDWPQVALQRSSPHATPVDLNTLTRTEVRGWYTGQRLLLSGTLLTARDAAHKRLSDLAVRNEPFPISLAGRVLYYTGPVKAAGDEIIGPAGPTTAERLDRFLDMTLEHGILATIGKGERGEVGIAAIRKHGAASLIAVGGAAFLVSKAISSSRVLALEDLGMEAIRELKVEDMPVMVAVDAEGRSIHADGPAHWREHILTMRKDNRH